MKKSNEWPRKRRNTLRIRVDPEFQQFIEKEYPNCFNPERTSKILDRLLGKDEKKKR